jgi:hypothetical protein
VADIAKMFAKIFLRKSDFGSKNTIFAKIWSDFCEIPQTKSRKSDSTKNFFHDFCDFSATLWFSRNKYFYDPFRAIFPQLYNFRDFSATLWFSGKKLIFPFFKRIFYKYKVNASLL